MLEAFEQDFCQSKHVFVLPDPDFIQHASDIDSTDFSWAYCNLASFSCTCYDNISKLYYAQEPHHQALEKFFYHQLTGLKTSPVYCAGCNTRYANIVYLSKQALIWKYNAIAGFNGWVGFEPVEKIQALVKLLCAKCAYKYVKPQINILCNVKHIDGLTLTAPYEDMSGYFPVVL